MTLMKGLSSYLYLRGHGMPGWTNIPPYLSGGGRWGEGVRGGWGGGILKSDHTQADMTMPKPNVGNFHNL